MGGACGVREAEEAVIPSEWLGTSEAAGSGVGEVGTGDRTRNQRAEGFMNQQVKLSAELAKWDWLKEKLGAENFDAVDLVCILESETNLAEILLEIAESALEDEGAAEVCKARMKSLQERASRLDKRAEKKRMVIGATMRNACITEKPIHGPTITLSFRKGSRDVIVMDQAKLPKQYMRIIPEEERVDMKSLRTALENGEPVEGAQLANDYQSGCVIRVK
jgi:hypothetical protein